jgi:hypothetical protein
VNHQAKKRLTKSLTKINQEDDIKKMLADIAGVSSPKTAAGSVKSVAALLCAPSAFYKIVRFQKRALTKAPATVVQRDAFN